MLAEVTRRFIHVAADQEHLALTMRATALAEDNVAAAAARVAAARAPDVELRRARVTRARVGVAARARGARAADVAAQARGDVGRHATRSFERVGADLYALPPSEGYEELVARLAGNPDFRALRDARSGSAMPSCASPKRTHGRI